MHRGTPTGEQHALAAGPYRAVAVEVGGGIRSLVHDGRDLLDGYAEDALPDGGRGQVLAPWPNRLRDGRWTWRGRTLQLPLTEVARATANHGLVRWAGWSALERSPERVVLAHRLHPQPGYPFRLDLRAAYAVDAVEGLAVELAATNAGDEEAPVALGQHPYLAAPGGGTVDGCRLAVPAATRLVVDDRGTPVGREAVEGTPYDLRQGRALGEQVVDDTFTDLVPGQSGRVRVELRGPDGSGTVLWTERPAGWLQVFTGDTLAEGRRRRGVAVEPMTAPGNALASGTGLQVLAPGETLALRWGVAAL
ncbi:aldose 1-epimerase family protein [Vallicoccus soli]|uniref:Aldose epimerase n=1 Tax=Vallicoccus soli TaxID=2339232 RepID=A0A3A3YZA1_9ACTN|nr:aldose 1-epimerase family protein [Vallicoccus soli]RJK93390.1 aldose epimerase [Vallicoccus soli]